MKKTIVLSALALMGTACALYANQPPEAKSADAPKQKPAPERSGQNIPAEIQQELLRRNPGSFPGSNVSVPFSSNQFGGPVTAYSPQDQSGLTTTRVHNYSVAQPVTTIGPNGVPTSAYVVSNVAQPQLLYRTDSGDIASITPDKLDKDTQQLTQEFSSALAKAYQVLRSATPDADKLAESKKFVSDLLHFQFKQDIERRKEQIAAIEKQVSELKEQLIKRESSEERLVNLRMELIENEGNGLAFPSSWSNGPMGAGYDVAYPPAIPPQASGFGYPSLYNNPVYNGPSRATAPAITPPQPAQPPTTTVNRQ